MYLEKILPQAPLYLVSERLGLTVEQLRKRIWYWNTHNPGDPIRGAHGEVVLKDLGKLGVCFEE